MFRHIYNEFLWTPVLTSASYDETVEKKAETCLPNTYISNITNSYSYAFKKAENLNIAMANPVPKVATAQGAIPPALAPSVEKAYKLKCIDLKRRMNEVEESNNAYRLRKVRLMRGIRKMRLERAFLLETLGKRMRKNGSGINGLTGTYDEDSEGSSESPPTVSSSSWLDNQFLPHELTTSHLSATGKAPTL